MAVPMKSSRKQDDLRQRPSRVRRFLFLLIFFSFASRTSFAQPAMSEMVALWNQCMAASSTAQCQQVLPACQRFAAGIEGMRRAFLVAGAETLITSLWRVHDDATGELMGIYYRKLLASDTPSDRLGAMIDAMRELRQRPGRSHPYF